MTPWRTRPALVALVALLALPALAPPAAATATCPDAAIVSPAPSSIVLAVGGVPVTIHACAQLGYTVTIKDGAGNVLGSASGAIAPLCGHGDTMVAVTWAGVFVGPASVELTTQGCGFLQPPAAPVPLLLLIKA